jgi:hypothetical protein
MHPTSRYRSAALFVAVIARAAPAAAAEVVPLIGINKPTGRNGGDYDPGLHLGLSLGGRVSDIVSLHGQFNLHFLNPENEADGWDSLGFSLLFAPLFHVQAGRQAELVLGPTLGVFRYQVEGDLFGQPAGGRATGLQLGLFTAVLFPLRGGSSVGPVLTFARLWADEVCAEIGSARFCDEDPDNEDDGILTLGAGFWF